MDRVESIFGQLPLTKVGTFNFKDEQKVMDVYAARLNRGKSTDKTVALMMVEHQDKNPGVARIVDLDWRTFTVRSYPHLNAMFAAVRQINVNGAIGSLKEVTVSRPKWGRLQDTILSAERRSDVYTSYKSQELAFGVTAYVESGSERGNDLENQVELIPVLESYNFAITKQ